MNADDEKIAVAIKGRDIRDEEINAAILLFQTELAKKVMAQIADNHQWFGTPMPPGPVIVSIVIQDGKHIWRSSPAPSSIAWTKCLPDIDMAQLGEES
jgi:hypothetical protein